MASPDCPSTRSPNDAWVRVDPPNSLTQGRRLMTRAPWCSLVLLSAIVVLPPAQVSPDADAQVRHTVIAASGNAAPTGGTYLPFSFINARLNTRHEVAFDAVVSGPPLTTSVFAGASLAAVGDRHSEAARIPAVPALSVRYSTHSSRQTGTSSRELAYLRGGRPEERCARGKWGSGARWRHPDGGSWYP